MRITNDSKASAQLDYCNYLLVGTSVSNIWPAYSLFRIHFLGSLLKNLAFAALRLFLLICIGFLFITDHNFQDWYFRFQCIAFPTAILFCRPCPTVCAHVITAIFFLFLANMYSFTKNCNDKVQVFLIRCLGPME